MRKVDKVFTSCQTIDLYIGLDIQMNRKEFTKANVMNWVLGHLCAHIG